MHLLVTRPAGDGETTAGRLRELGHDPLLEPLLEIVTLDPPEIETNAATQGSAEIQAFVATSANGIRALAATGISAEMKSHPVMAIGEASAKEARKAGFETVLTGGGTLPALADDIVDRFSPNRGRIVYLAGRARSGDLAGLLAGSGFTTETRTLYEARRKTALSAGTARALANGEIDGILLFSARTAGIYRDLVRAANLDIPARDIPCFCLSRPVAGKLPDTFKRILVASEPTLDSLLASIESYGK